MALLTIPVFFFGSSIDGITSLFLADLNAACVKDLILVTDARDESMEFSFSRTDSSWHRVTPIIKLFPIILPLYRSAFSHSPRDVNLKCSQLPDEQTFSRIVPQPEKCDRITLIASIGNPKTVTQKSLGWILLPLMDMLLLIND